MFVALGNLDGIMKALLSPFEPPSAVIDYLCARILGL